MVNNNNTGLPYGWITTGDCDSMPPMKTYQDSSGNWVTSTVPLVTITYHEKGQVYTVVLSSADVDIFLTNAQKVKLAKKIRLGRMVEKL